MLKNICNFKKQTYLCTALQKKVVFNTKGSLAQLVQSIPIYKSGESASLIFFSKHK